MDRRAGSEENNGVSHDWDHDIVLFGMPEGETQHMVMLDTSAKDPSPVAQLRMFSSNQLVKDIRSLRQDPMFTTFPQANISEGWLRKACGHLNRYLETKGMSIRFHIDPQCTSTIRAEPRGTHPNGDIRVVSSEILREVVAEQVKLETSTLAVHDKISCDACGQLPIMGIRFACVSCPDFDVCGACWHEQFERSMKGGEVKAYGPFPYGILSGGPVPA